jgi:hypothetical protein
MDPNWFILLGVFVAFVLGARAIVRWGKRRPADEEGVCGHCGYSVKGLPSSICPECGSDLEVVGVRRGSFWFRLSPEQRNGLVILSWTIGYGLAVWLIWVPFHERLQPGICEAVDMACWVVPGTKLRVSVHRCVTQACWPWQRESLKTKITTPEHWAVMVNTTGGISSDFISDWEQQGFAKFAKSSTAAEQEKFALWSRHDASCQRHYREGKFIVLDYGTAYAWYTPQEERLWYRDLKEYIYRRENHAESLDRWLQVWGDRHNALELPRLMHRTIGLVMLAPFRQTQHIAPAPGTGLASGGGLRWHPNEWWTGAYVTTAVLGYLIWLGWFAWKDRKRW